MQVFQQAGVAKVALIKERPGGRAYSIARKVEERLSQQDTHRLEHSAACYRSIDVLQITARDLTPTGNAIHAPGAVLALAVSLSFCSAQTSRGQGEEGGVVLGRVVKAIGQGEKGQVGPLGGQGESLASLRRQACECGAKV